MSKLFTIAGLFVVALVVAPVSAQAALVDDDFTGFAGGVITDVPGWSTSGDASAFNIIDTGIAGIGEALQSATSPCCPNGDRFWTVPGGTTIMNISFDMISTGGTSNNGFKFGDNPNQGAAGGGTYLNGFTNGTDWVGNPTDGDGADLGQINFGAITIGEIVTLHMDVDGTAGTFSFFMEGPTLGTSSTSTFNMGAATMQDFNLVRWTLGGSNAVIYDNLQVVIPEPSSICLLGLGSLMLMLRLRRRRR